MVSDCSLPTGRSSSNSLDTTVPPVRHANPLAGVSPLISDRLSQQVVAHDTHRKTTGFGMPEKLTMGAVPEQSGTRLPAPTRMHQELDGLDASD